MPAGGTPPDPWKITTEHGVLFVYASESVEYEEIALCDRDGHPTPDGSEHVAGFIAHVDVVAALRAAIG
jgi:hypothetical protein